jgi:hypothetical protein
MSCAKKQISKSSTPDSASCILQRCSLGWGRGLPHQHGGILGPCHVFHGGPIWGAARRKRMVELYIGAEVGGR